MRTIRNPVLLALASVAAILAMPGAGRAQRATEQYIPIGKSPGLSGMVTVIGTCTAVQAKERTVTVRCGETVWIGQVTKDTKIYVDRSDLRQPNTNGTFEDLKSGSRIEVKYREGQRKSLGVCDWIKIQAAPAPAKKG